MKKIAILGVLSCLSFPALSDSYKTYSPYYGVKYALDNVETKYAKYGDWRDSNNNPFPSYGGIGGNCTNFASQSLIGGFSRVSTPGGVFNKRYSYDVDRSSDANRWYFRCNGSSGKNSCRGEAWAGANELYRYAKNNKMSHKGLHFEYITNDSPDDFMEYRKVNKGDIIFADWTGDGNIDHTMIVNRSCKSWSCKDQDGERIYGYNRVRVTYQSIDTPDRGLGEINEKLNYKALFYVYRPVNYNPEGI